MGAKTLIASFLVSACLIALGWNTLDWMVNTFAWGEPVDWANPVWYMNTWFQWDFWNCAIFFGVLPFGGGAIVFGWSLRTVYQMATELQEIKTKIKKMKELKIGT